MPGGISNLLFTVDEVEYFTVESSWLRHFNTSTQGNHCMCHRNRDKNDFSTEIWKYKIHKNNSKILNA